MDTLIKRRENALVEALKLSRKTKYNITRNDGWRVNILKIRNGASKKKIITEKNIKDVKKLRAKGLTLEKTAKKLGIDKSRVVRIMRIVINKKYTYLPSNEKISKFKNKIILLRKKGYSHYQIRQKLHVSGTVVSIVLTENNLDGERHSKRDLEKRRW